VELVIERLHDWGVIQEKQYGEMPIDRVAELAEEVKARSDE
jgi:hypothetical protein